ncbi:11580_t:CDS:2 [Dentiscutata heterogama]|uniref:11580_t:CDS:1 n=1 Tax=Dentiscutata heterogama TaxID=1316150 RepID=A0ACA9K098_9GLOM|nr:11580_t:CDS:2 [Dentiscutata heterogama]
MDLDLLLAQTEFLQSDNELPDCYETSDNELLNCYKTSDNEFPDCYETSYNYETTDDEYSNNRSVVSEEHMSKKKRNCKINPKTILEKKDRGCESTVYMLILTIDHHIGARKNNTLRQKIFAFLRQLVYLYNEHYGQLKAWPKTVMLYINHNIKKYLK